MIYILIISMTTNYIFINKSLSFSTLYFFIIGKAFETYFRQFRHLINFTAFRSLMGLIIYVAIKVITHSTLCTNLLNIVCVFLLSYTKIHFVLYLELHSLRQKILKGKVRCNFFCKTSKAL